MSNGHDWLRSCFKARHNKGRGERELRGERRGKGGRTLLATAAPSFFISLLFGPASAQRVELYAGTGVVASTLLVRDEVATPALRQLIGSGVYGEVTARPSLGPWLSLAGRLPVRPRVALELEGVWAPAELQAEEDGVTRNIQNLHVIDVSLGAAWQLRRRVEAGAAAGVLLYVTERRSVFAEGSDLAPTVRAQLTVQLPVWSDRLSLRGSAQTHRFGTAAIRRVGGTEGFVTRVQLGARVRLRGAAR